MAQFTSTYWQLWLTGQTYIQLMADYQEKKEIKQVFAWYISLIICYWPSTEYTTSNISMESYFLLQIIYTFLSSLLHIPHLLPWPWYWTLTRAWANHGLIQWVGWKGLQRSCTSNPSAMDRNTFHWTRLFRASPSLALNTSRNGKSPAYLSNLFQCLTGKLPWKVPSQ